MSQASPSVPGSHMDRPARTASLGSNGELSSVQDELKASRMNGLGEVFRDQGLDFGFLRNRGL